VCEVGNGAGPVAPASRQAGGRPQTEIVTMNVAAQMTVPIRMAYQRARIAASVEPSSC
jgi:hypothetical protein